MENHTACREEEVYRKIDPEVDMCGRKVFYQLLQVRWIGVHILVGDRCKERREVNSTKNARFEGLNSSLMFSQNPSIRWPKYTPYWLQVQPRGQSTQSRFFQTSNTPPLTPSPSPTPTGLDHVKSIVSLIDWLTNRLVKLLFHINGLSHEVKICLLNLHQLIGLVMFSSPSQPAGNIGYITMLSSLLTRECGRLQWSI